VLVVVPRLPTGLMPDGLAATSLALPAGLKLFDALNEAVGPQAALQQFWQAWPVALLSTRRLSAPFPKQDLPRK
jgi:hypothetical protein